MGENSCTRRDFLSLTGIGAGSLLLSSCGLNKEENSHRAKVGKAEKPKHIITLSFDDGFKKSSIRTAEIYEKHNLSACINVIATAHLDTFGPPGEYIAASDKGDFGLWNELKQRGHEVMPHSYKHVNLRQLPLAEAKDLIRRCLDHFSKELKGFEPKDSVYSFAYNASTPELETWLAGEVMAFRTGGGAINPLPQPGQVKLTCTSYGPANCERDIEAKISQLFDMDSGWLIYNTHGLDGEGWGPIRSTFLDKLLERLSAIESVAILPAGMALSQLGGA